MHPERQRDATESKRKAAFSKLRKKVNVNKRNERRAKESEPRKVKPIKGKRQRTKIKKRKNI